jgi:hypothetical protein
LVQFFEWARGASVRRLIVNSFVTAKVAPNDVDLIMFVAGHQVNVDGLAPVKSTARFAMLDLGDRQVAGTRVAALVKKLRPASCDNCQTKA